MTDGQRAELFTRLADLHRACPDIRLGQLICNMAVIARGTDPGAVWDVEDTELLDAINWQLAELLSRRGAEVA